MDYIFDTHAHYDDEAFDADREEVLTGLKEQGIGTVVNVGASIASTKTTLALAETHSFMYAAVGVHPNETAELTDADMKWLESWQKIRRLWRSVRSVLTTTGTSRAGDSETLVFGTA